MSLPRFTFTERARPFLEVGVGDSRSPAPAARWDVQRWDAPDALWSGIEPTWLDVSCEAFRCRCEYGRKRSTDRFVPGVATVDVSNASGWADPYATGSPASLTMRPGRAIRFGVDHATLGRVVLWRGFIDAMLPTYDPLQPDTVSMSCVDALGEVNRAKAVNQPERSDGERVDSRLTAGLALYGWPSAKAIIEPNSMTLVAGPLNGQAADVLGRITDSGGGSIYGDREGNVVARGRDWQVFAPGTPVAGTIGNVEPGRPAVPPSLISHGYLTPTVGTASTPDAADLRVIGDFRVTAKIRDDSAEAAASRYVIMKGHSSTDLGYALVSTFSSTLYYGLGWPTGTTSPQIAAAGGTRAQWGLTPSGTDRYVGATFRGVNPASSALSLLVRGLASTDGATWTPYGNAPAALRADGFSRDDSAPLRIGANNSNLAAWSGRIYWAQVERLDAAGNPTEVVWRFDADDYPGTGTSYVDPRGRTWTLTNAAAITPKVVDPGSPAVPADVCPTSWDRPFNRADIATVVIMGRDPETALVLRDEQGIAVYGEEPFERTDLLTRTNAELTLLAQRAMRVRSWDTAPVVRAVTLDASTSADALDLMATADPYGPTHYRCRLQLDRGLVFDAAHLVTGIVHELTAEQWQTAINLDLAQPYEAVGGRWDSAQWDRALWDEGVALLNDLRNLIGATP